jgi:hypothetical protein
MHLVEQSSDLLKRHLFEPRSAFMTLQLGITHTDARKESAGLFKLGALAQPS